MERPQRQKDDGGQRENGPGEIPRRGVRGNWRVRHQGRHEQTDAERQNAKTKHRDGDQREDQGCCHDSGGSIAAHSNVKREKHQNKQGAGKPFPAQQEHKDEYEKEERQGIADRSRDAQQPLGGRRARIDQDAQFRGAQGFSPAVQRMGCQIDKPPRQTQPQAEQNVATDDRVFPAAREQAGPRDERVWPAAADLRLQRKINGHDNEGVEEAGADGHNAVAERAFEGPKVVAAYPEPHLDEADERCEPQRAAVVALAVHRVPAREKPHRDANDDRDADQDEHAQPLRDRLLTGRHSPGRNPRSKEHECGRPAAQGSGFDP